RGARRAPGHAARLRPQPRPHSDPPGTAGLRLPLEARMSTALLPAAYGDGIDALIQATLAPQADAIDKGLYPGDFMRSLGRLGGFGAALPAASGGLGLALAAQIDIIARARRACGSTAFLTWCQAACAWYLRQTGNAAARDRYLAPIVRGEILAGTGMSNAVKHLAGIERINLRGRRENDGYRVSGALPWVSNLGPADRKSVV